MAAAAAAAAGLLGIGVVAAIATEATHGFNARSTAAAAAAGVNMNCTLIVPANPLTAQGLATPYQFTATNPADGPCNEADSNQTAFVQGAVLNPATGQISIYNPLVIDQGTQPAAPPVVPALPAGAVVAVWFGFNGNTLTLEGADQAGTTAASASPAATGVTTGTTAAATQSAVAGQAPQTGAAAGQTATPTGTGTAAPPTTMPTQTTTATPTAPGLPTTPAGTATPTAPGQPTAPAGTATPTVPGLPTVPATTPGSTAPAATGTTPPANADVPAASGTPDAILQQNNCIAGESIQGTFSSFTQVGTCNGVAFFQAANAAIAAGKLTVPTPGSAKDAQACETTRSFALIDQDQSDNVTTEYLANGNGQIAQDTTANQQALGGNATLLFNGSDNGLLDLFVDPALGCTPWMVPNLGNGGAPGPALPLDELQAAAFAGQSGPPALVPLNDPMTLDNNGNFSTAKTNAYRSMVDQLPLPAGETPAEYCGNMEAIQGVRLQQDVNLLTDSPSPLPAASNLFTFMAMRLQQSFMNLKCRAFGMRNDVSTTTDGAGVVVAACFRQQVNAVTPGPGNPTAGMKVCPATTGGASPTASASATASGTATAPAHNPHGRGHTRHRRYWPQSTTWRVMQDQRGWWGWWRLWGVSYGGDYTYSGPRDWW
ncbi:MAG: hypothetical protein JO132_20175 [Streptosporangiaceae bacterium]|nr:hypothetical protein [Streptosporangiaceae bacterium]